MNEEKASVISPDVDKTVADVVEDEEDDMLEETIGTILKEYTKK
jgi:hypothetical protein